LNDPVLNVLILHS